MMARLIWMVKLANAMSMGVCAKFPVLTGLLCNACFWVPLASSPVREQTGQDFDTSHNRCSVKGLLQR